MLKPRNDYIVVRRDKPLEKSAGGIALVLATDASQEPAQGIVVAKGPKVSDQIDVGDRLVIGHFGGLTVKVNGEDMVMLRESDTKDGPLAVIE